MLFILLVSLLSVAAVSMLFYFNGTQLLKRTAYDKIGALKQQKKHAIENFFAEFRNQVEIFSEDLVVIDATEHFIESYHKISPKDETNSKEISDELKKYYSTDFIPEYNKNTQSQSSANNFLPNSFAAKYLQYHYIAKSRFETGEKDFQMFAFDNSDYTQYHKKYHAKFKAYQQKSNYNDIFIVDPKTNDIVYSIFKKIDYGQNLNDKLFAKTGLSELVNKVKQTNKTLVLDYKFYAPNYNRPTAFVATPVYKDYRLTGVLIFQIPSNLIDNTISGNRGWEKEGLGKTGDVFLLGEDLMLRSNPRVLFEKKDDYIGKLKKSNYDKKLISQINALNSSILLQKFDDKVLKKAFTGESGQLIVNDYLKNEVLLDYSPLEIEGLNWAVVSVLSADEAFAQVNELRNQTILLTLIIAGIVILISYFLARSISRPINSVSHTVETLAAGEFTMTPLKSKTKDEIGKMIRAVNALEKRFAEIALFSTEIGTKNFDVDFQALSDDDMIGTSLVEMRDALKNASIREYIQARKQEIIQKISENLRVVEELEDVLQGVLATLSLEMNIVQSGIYLTEQKKLESGESESVLEIFVANGLELSYMSRKFMRSDEGMPGKAIVSRSTVHITNVPNNYFTSNSLVGSATANELLFIPMVINQNVLGVIEFGKFSGFSHEDIETLENITRSVAASVAVYKANIHTVQLLQEAQQLNEQLESNQKELQENNEEMLRVSKTLEAKNEELKNATIELENAIEAVRNSEKMLEQKVEERTKDLQLAKEDAEKANKVKSVFLANMSHELRTPLNAILGYAQILHSTPLEPDVLEKVDIINKSGEHLLSLINEVLDLSKIEAGKMEVYQAPVNLNAMLSEVFNMFKHRCEEKGLLLQIELDNDPPERFIGDYGKIKQCLINLVGNAVKFTRSGRIEIKAIYHQDEKLTFAVEDTGRGIPQEKIEDILLPFKQNVEQINTEGGTGLGLAITKSYIELMGGKLFAESEYGKGSTFSFILPIQLTEEKTILEKQNETFASNEYETELLSDDKEVLKIRGGGSYKMLIVDDIPVNRQVASEILTKVGFEIAEAENGIEAIKMYEEFKPDLIFMDIKMPKMDGKEATRQIRLLPKGNNVKIIALTASAFMEEHRKIMDSGCDYIVTKPFKTNDLFNAIQNFLGISFDYKVQGSSAAGSHKSQSEFDFMTIAQKLGENMLAELQDALDIGDYSEIPSILAGKDLDFEEYDSFKEYVSKLVKNMDFMEIESVIEKLH